MSSRSVTRIVTPTATRAFHLPNGAPHFQVPRIGQFLLMKFLSGEPVTGQGWADFAASTTAEIGHPVVAAEEVEPDASPADIDHLYVIAVDDGFSFTHFRHLRVDSSSDPVVADEAETLAQVLEVACRYADELVLRIQAAPGVDSEAMNHAQRCAATVRDMARFLELADGDYHSVSAERLPARHPDQDLVEHGHAVAAFCAQRAQHLLEVAADSTQRGLFEQTAKATREARGFTRAGYCHGFLTAV